ncbi:MAG: hypothetical protein HC822_16600 [Oscillochloris sp.]|nr:hypothetical protein [Oscillochloris sp.]
MNVLRYFGFALICALAFVLSACGGAGIGENAEQPGTTGEFEGTDDGVLGTEGEVNPDLSDVDDDAEELYGQNVTVTGEVVEAYNDQMFRIEEAELLAGDDVLVFFPAGAAPVEGSVVEVSGVVQEFNESELEQNLGIQIDDALGLNFTDQPVIVADQVNETTVTQ